METIKNYLESMFRNLPNTSEVLKAKAELLQMMEDKYTELRREGKSENEAVATVISEFGNLDELADSLGIKHVIHNDQEPHQRRNLSLDEVCRSCIIYYLLRACDFLWKHCTKGSLWCLSHVHLRCFGSCINGYSSNKNGTVEIYKNRTLLNQSCYNRFCFRRKTKVQKCIHNHEYLGNHFLYLQCCSCNHP